MGRYEWRLWCCSVSLRPMFLCIRIGEVYEWIKGTTYCDVQTSQKDLSNDYRHWVLGLGHLGARSDLPPFSTTTQIQAFRTKSPSDYDITPKLFPRNCNHDRISFVQTQRVRAGWRIPVVSLITIAVFCVRRSEPKNGRVFIDTPWKERRALNAHPVVSLSGLAIGYVGLRSPL